MLGKKAKKALKLLLSLSKEERAAIVGELGDADDLEEDDKETTSDETAEVEESGEETQVETTEVTETETESAPDSDEDAAETDDAEEVQEVAESTENEQVTEEAAQEVTDENTADPGARIGALESAIQEIKETLKALAARFGDGEETPEESFGLGAAAGDEGLSPEKKLDATRKKYFGF